MSLGWIHTRLSDDCRLPGRCHSPGRPSDIWRRDGEQLQREWHNADYGQSHWRDRRAANHDDTNQRERWHAHRKRSFSMGVLVGDVNGNAVVNATDVALTKS